MKPILRRANQVPCMFILICVIFAVTASTATAGRGAHCPCFKSGQIFGISHAYNVVYCSDDEADAYIAMFDVDPPADFTRHAAFETRIVGEGPDETYECERYTVGFPRPGVYHQISKIDFDEYQQCYEAILKAMDHGICQ